MKYIFSFTVLFSLVLSMVFFSITLHVADATYANSPKFVANKLIVGFKSEIGKEQVEKFYLDHRSDYGLSDDQTISTDQFGRTIKLVKTAANVSDALIENLKRDPRVDYVEPDYIVTIDTINTNDPLRGQLWGLDNTGQSINKIRGTGDQDIDAPEAWAISTGSQSTVVGIIDTGIDYTHPDLAGNIWKNPGEIPNDGIDNDSNGYVDDYYGWNAITNTGNNLDDNNHGTHVAGTIGAMANNGQGVVGVSQQVKIIACKFLSSSGSGSTSDAVKCFDYFKNLKSKGVNIVITNNSWGGGGYSSTLYNAMNNGILHAVAAGNSGVNIDSSPSYPASYSLDNILTVAATDNTDSYASFTNYGSVSVDVAAPGVNILSTIRGNTYANYSGTSMATPHVSGMAALAWSVDPCMSAVQGKNLIMSNGDSLSTVTKTTVSNKRINAYSVLNKILNPGGSPDYKVCSAPSYFEVTAGTSKSTAVTTTNLNGFNSVIALSAPTASGITNSISAITPSISDMTFTVPPSTLPGNYTVAVSAISGSTTKTITVIIKVVQPLRLSLTNNPSYLTNNNIPILIKTTDNIGNVSGSSVTMSVKSPNGGIKTFTGTTDSNGSKTFTYSIGSVKGKYLITSSGTATGHKSSGPVTSTFTVI